MVGIDKLKHYIVATWISALWLTVFDRAVWFDFLGQYAVFVGFGLFIIGIIAFEYYQKWSKKGTKDWVDVMYGAWGAAIILVTILATKG